MKAKFASSIRRVDERTLALTDEVDGKPAGIEEIKISPDHNVLTMTTKSVGQSRPEIRGFDREQRNDNESRGSVECDGGCYNNQTHAHFRLDQ